MPERCAFENYHGGTSHSLSSSTSAGYIAILVKYTVRRKFNDTEFRNLPLNSRLRRRPNPDKNISGRKIKSSHFHEE